MEKCKSPSEEPKITVARAHGREQASLPNYSLPQVIQEYRLLRRMIFDSFPESLKIRKQEQNAIIDTIELGIAEAVVAFVENQYQLREQFVAALAHDL